MIENQKMIEQPHATGNSGRGSFDFCSNAQRSPVAIKATVWCSADMSSDLRQISPSDIVLFLFTLEERDMALVRASDVDFNYPLVGFSRGQGILGFSDFVALTRCHAAYVRDEALIGMELIDNDLRRWFVRSLHLNAPLVEKRWWHIFMAIPYPEFDLDLEEAASIGLDDLKRRLLVSWELEDPDNEEGVRQASSLAAMFDAAQEQGSGLL